MFSLVGLYNYSQTRSLDGCQITSQCLFRSSSHALGGGGSVGGERVGKGVGVGVGFFFFFAGRSKIERSNF